MQIILTALYVGNRTRKNNRYDTDRCNLQLVDRTRQLVINLYKNLNKLEKYKVSNVTSGLSLKQSGS